ncbi:MAG TPA: hypothetical protein VFP40_02480 [Terriglobales bacterium]|nr:hypothetical protein [Terriglobales bacterium]
MVRNLIVSLLLPLAMSAQQSQAPAASATQAMYNAQVNSTQKKFDYIRANGAKPSPDQTPTVIHEREINAWLTSGDVQFPDGVKRLQLQGQPGIIHATATVDFDQVTGGRYSGNPLMSLFRGTHEVKATAHAQASGHQGQVHIDSVEVDGVSVPRMALQYFADKYITPKHPNLGIDSTFALPYKIDTAVVGSGEVSVTQK